MRIIAGRFRGKKLDWVSDATTRPTTDRVKENIFNVLTSMGVDFNNAKVLVPFAGSGQMGLECHSRGAQIIIFNDTDATAQKLIKRNCLAMGLAPQIVALDYLACIDKLKSQKFNLIFLDPPFADLAAPINASQQLLKNDMLERDAVIVCETECDTLEFAGFDVRKKKYGRAVIYFLTKE